MVPSDFPLRPDCSLGLSVTERKDDMHSHQPMGNNLHGIYSLLETHK